MLALTTAAYVFITPILLFVFIGFDRGNQMFDLRDMEYWGPYALIAFLGLVLAGIWFMVVRARRKGAG